MPSRSAGLRAGRVKAPTTICDEQHGDNPRIGVGTIPARVPGTRRCGHMPASKPVSTTGVAGSIAGLVAVAVTPVADGGSFRALARTQPPPCDRTAARDRPARLPDTASTVGSTAATEFAIAIAAPAGLNTAPVGWPLCSRRRPPSATSTAARELKISTSGRSMPRYQARDGRQPWRAFRTMPSGACLNGLTCAGGGAWEGEVLATFTRSDDLQGAEFVDANLRGARFRRADLSGVVMRAVDVSGADIDDPFPFKGESSLRVNGVDVVPLVEAELNRRFPGRAGRRAEDPDGLRGAWAALEQTWAATLEGVAAMPAGTVDVSVGGEWSFAQTLRHLVMATDAWLGRAILGIEQPFHTIGEPNAEYETDGNDTSIFAAVTPPYADLLRVRAGRVAMVRDFLATVTSDDLAATRKNPWAPEYPETILSCLHVILNEEWEHHRYAVRDLNAIDAASDA